jgi:hypothetical protein
MCGSASDGVKGYPYQSDINTAQQQSQTTVNALKSDHVTTVVCWCDPIAPVFLTQTMAQNNYHPEHLMAGVGLIDYDVLGRLYEPSEWKNAFGPSQLMLAKAFVESDAMKAWQDAGNTGEPDATENLAWAYYSIMASSFQVAGPRVTPVVMHEHLLAQPAAGGWALTHDQHYPLVAFRVPSPWTALEDMREVYWCASRPSEVDNKPGSYEPVDGGHRFNLGEWPTGDPQVFTRAC